MKIIFVLLLWGQSAFAMGEAYLSSGVATIASGATRYDVAPGYAHDIFPWLAVGAELSYSKSAYMDTSVSSMVVLAGPMLNFGATLSDSFFVSLGVAYRSGSSSPASTATTTTTTTATADDPNGVGFYLVTGKRFPLIGALSFRPSIGVVATGTTGIIIRPLALSYAL